MMSAAENRYYTDIHRIAKSLEVIAKRLGEITENTKPVEYDPMMFDFNLNQEDDSKEDDGK